MVSCTIILYSPEKERHCCQSHYDSPSTIRHTLVLKILIEGICIRSYEMKVFSCYLIHWAIALKTLSLGFVLDWCIIC